MACLANFLSCFDLDGKAVTFVSGLRRNLQQENKKEHSVTRNATVHGVIT